MTTSWRRNDVTNSRDVCCAVGEPSRPSNSTFELAVDERVAVLMLAVHASPWRAGRIVNVWANTSASELTPHRQVVQLAHNPALSTWVTRSDDGAIDPLIGPLAVGVTSESRSGPGMPAMLSTDDGVLLVAVSTTIAATPSFGPAACFLKRTRLTGSTSCATAAATARRSLSGAGARIRCWTCPRSPATATPTATDPPTRAWRRNPGLATTT